MQFGIGILGRRWTAEFAREQAAGNAQPARRNFGHHARCYAAKLAAETLLAEPPTEPDLSDEALISRFATCALMVRPSEIHMVREAFVSEYSLSHFPSETPTP